MWIRQACLLVSFTGALAGPDTACFVQHKYNINPEEPNQVVLPDEKALLVEAEDQQAAEVRFVRHGMRFAYNLSASSLYTEDAAVTAWTENGLVTREKRTRFYRSMEPGKRAQATLHEDGTVSGLFETDGHIMRISKGEHKFRQSSKPRTREREIKDDRVHYYHDDETQPWFYTSDDVDGAMPHVSYEGESSQYPLPSSRPWDGEKWYPDCFSGDDSMNVMKIRVMADTKAHAEVGAGLQASIEQAVAEASFVFENQMNIQLVIDNFHIFETQTGLSAKELKLNDETCVDSDSENVMIARVEDMKDYMDTQPLHAASHLFTGCGNGRGVIGVAWVGGLCDRTGYNTGVNQMTGDDTFLTFAHELGHNFGMHHPFSFGKEQSKGGIMDYGDGLLDGEYQFNRQWRRPEACPILDDMMNHCEENFGSQAPTFAPTPYPTIVPASTGAFGDFINHIINWIRALLDGIGSGNLIGSQLRVSEEAHNFKALINNFLYKNLVALAHNEDETQTAEQILEALKDTEVQKKIHSLVEGMNELNQAQQEVISQILPHLDVSKAIMAGTPADVDEVRELLL